MHKEITEPIIENIVALFSGHGVVKEMSHFQFSLTFLVQ